MNHLDKNRLVDPIWRVDRSGFDGDGNLSQCCGSDGEQKCCDVLTQHWGFPYVVQGKSSIVWWHKLKHPTFCNHNHHLWRVKTWRELQVICHLADFSSQINSKWHSQNILLLFICVPEFNTVSQWFVQITNTKFDSDAALKKQFT